MTPIINPWFFYLISIVDGLNAFFSSISYIFGLLGGSLIFIDILTGFSELTDNIRKKAKGMIIICILTSAISLFIPPKSTLTQMLIAQNFTYENVELTKKEGKELIDYIITITKDKEKK